MQIVNKAASLCERFAALFFGSICYCMQYHKRPIFQPLFFFFSDKNEVGRSITYLICDLTAVPKHKNQRRMSAMVNKAGRGVGQGTDLLMVKKSVCFCKSSDFSAFTNPVEYDIIFVVIK